MMDKATLPPGDTAQTGSKATTDAVAGRTHLSAMTVRQDIRGLVRLGGRAMAPAHGSRQIYGRPDGCPSG